jgi:glycerol-3-phosphate dehydrogenase
VAAAVIHAVRSEMAMTLADVVVRRTGLGAGGYPDREVVAVCGDLMAAELGWSADRLATEKADLGRFYAPVEPAPE